MQKVQVTKVQGDNKTTAALAKLEGSIGSRRLSGKARRAAAQGVRMAEWKSGGPKRPGVAAIAKSMMENALVEVGYRQSMYARKSTASLVAAKIAKRHKRVRDALDRVNVLRAIGEKRLAEEINTRMLGAGL